MRFAELFAGAGGLSMGLERAGWSCVWHAEIADAPRAILAHRWPDVPLYGDVTTLNGNELAAKHGAIDLLTGGSPCQDLSVAGKRAGFGMGGVITDEMRQNEERTRSSLFFEQMRLWDETGADLCLWENVDGARSSNDGKDFGEVLRAFVGAAVAVPSDGWRSAGVAAGPTGVAAWRVLDAQFFGVPQRRRRVFVLGTRTGRIDPAEVLSLAEGMCRDPSARGEAREDVAADARASVAIPILEVGKRTGVSTTDTRAGSGIGEDGDPMFTLQASAQHGVVAFDTMNQSVGTVAHTLRDPHGTFGDALPAVVCLTGTVTHALTSEGADAGEDGTGRGTPIVARMVAFGEYAEDDVASAIKARDFKDATDLVVGTLDAREHGGGFPGSDGAMSGHVQAPTGIPRRLTPRECERLMSWPDDHTLVPDAKGKPLSDAARYKACGNGVASVHSHWIGWRLALALGESA